MVNNQNKNQAQQNNPFPKMEEEVLNFWDKAKTFERSVKKTAPKGDYVFYDGPPFATGTPHYGHIVASLMKDAVPRYWTMKGYRVKRRWGWDCHGLPVENIAEKELGFKNKQDIEEQGTEKFNDYCKSIVLRFVNEWKDVIKRIGRWVDMENDYKTMDPKYMESIWWVFKSLWEKDLIYKGYKAMHMCPRCGTTLSNFEVTQNYKEIKDLSAVVRFELVDESDTYVLAWTTTPWTLLGNVALAVGKKIDYVKVESENKFYILAKSKLEGVFKNKKFKIIEEFKGDRLIGKGYRPLFNYYKDKSLENEDNGWQIYPANFVSTEEGTGVVHIAPAFGEDDMELGKEHKLPFVQHVDGGGRFKQEITDWIGEEVKPIENPGATDEKIVNWLESDNKLFSKEKYLHSYPHCWRCETPLLNYATDSWFVEVTKIKKNLVENNKKMYWVPAHIKDGRFGKWLEQARDWAISRNRYWGAPLPVWVCDSCDEKTVIGSRKELEKLSGQTVDDLHKQFVDKIELPCLKCNGKMKRIAEVLDCWFESGAMPYAQEHYPFENEKRFRKNFPAHFIAEGVDQTRGWFYTLMIFSTALFNKEIARNVIVNGIIMAEDGSKMSKSKNNFPDPVLIFDKYSVDALRYYLLSSPVLVAESLNFSEEGVKEAFRKVEMVLWNVYKFYEMYKGGLVAEDKRPDSVNVLDRWILTKLDQLTKEVTVGMNNYHLPKSIRPIGVFINNLSTWYIRRSRGRFKSDDEQDKEAALQTTSYVLLQFSKIIAPFMPFIAEQIWQKITGNNFNKQDKSVHLESWPETAKIDNKILEEMELVRQISEKGLAARDEAKIKVRQPLPYYSTSLTKKLTNDLTQLVKDELNVIELKFDKDELGTKLTKELEQEGVKRELIRFINVMRKNVKLTIKDKARVYWQSEDKEIVGVFSRMTEEIKKETLAEEIQKVRKKEIDAEREVKINKGKVWIGIKKK